MTTELQTKAEQLPANVVDEQPTDNVLVLIGRLASDPNSDLDKLERLMAMHERMEANKARQGFAEALARFQAKMPVVPRLKKGQTKKYAPFEHIMSIAQPLLSEEGLALTFQIKTEQEFVTVTPELRWGSHTEVGSAMTLPIDKGGNKNLVQAYASTTSYAKRYSGCGMLNITTKDEDDDGQAAGPTPLEIKAREWSDHLANAADMDGLKADFAQAYSQTDKRYRGIVKAAYDTRKAQLTEGEAAA